MPTRILRDPKSAPKTFAVWLVQPNFTQDTASCSNWASEIFIELEGSSASLHALQEMADVALPKWRWGTKKEHGTGPGAGMVNHEFATNRFNYG